MRVRRFACPRQPRRLPARWIVAAGVLLGVTAPAGSVRAQTGDLQEAIRREVESRTAELLAAFQRGDPLGVSSIFADDATILGPSGLRIHGREALDRYWTERPRPQSWRIATLEVGGSRDAPWQYARSIRVSDVDGREVTAQVDFILVWKRGTDGTLRIYLDLFN